MERLVLGTVGIVQIKTWVESCHKNVVKIVAQVEAQCDKEIAEPSLEVNFDDGA